MRVALVHDYLNQYGGAERVLEAFCEIWPTAPIYTLLYDKKRTGYAFGNRRVKTSFLQKIPFVKFHHRPFLMLMPLAVESLDLSKYDLIISDSSSFAKGVITRPQALHICYCHTPTRYAWDDSHKYIKEFGYPGFVTRFIPFLMNYLRVWDGLAAERPDRFIANSYFVASRIKKYYHQESEVIHPPVKSEIFYISEKSEDFFLMVARFLPYKRIDIAIKAFNKLKWPLKIIGVGPETKRLKRAAGETIEFLGLVSDEKLRHLYAKCRALIFPQEEDFGIAALEAMASGRPVIAYKSGGALEIVENNVNGIFFEKQTPESLIMALERFEEIKFEPEQIRAKAFQFDRDNFKQKIKEFVHSSWEEHKKTLDRT